jgi:hypothetical protein
MSDLCVGERAKVWAVRVSFVVPSLSSPVPSPQPPPLRHHLPTPPHEPMSVFLSMSVLWRELQGLFVFLALFSIAPPRSLSSHPLSLLLISPLFLLLLLLANLLLSCLPSPASIPLR